MEIKNIVARQILDSRGTPTVEADVILEDGSLGRAAVPSGASTGVHEAHELRDGLAAYHGQSVYTAIDNIHKHIVPKLRGIRADDQFKIDQQMIDLDGSSNKSVLGANALLAVSLAVAHAAAISRGVLLYNHIADIAQPQEKCLPMPMLNVLNGGKHADGSTDIKFTLKGKKYATTVGDEGGFAPHIKKGNAEAFGLLLEAIQNAGYAPGQDVSLAVDVAASELFKDNRYIFESEHKKYDSDTLTEWYKKMITTYPIISIEDGLAEDDWEGWQHLHASLPSTQLVGDDLLVTNTERLQYAIENNAANAILIKPNQIGTLTETIRAIQLAKHNGWNTIVSHRSGETEDVSIVHIAIGTGAGQIKTGSMSRSERVAKYNELLRLEELDTTLHLATPFS